MCKKIINFCKNLNPFIKYFLKLILYSFIIAAIVILSKTIGLKEFLKIPNAGVFFDWEIAILAHAAIVFFVFILDDKLDKMVPPKTRKISIFSVTTGIFFTVLIYIYSVMNFNEGFIYKFLRDSISFAPIFIFFVTNMIFLFFNIKKKKERVLFSKIICILDLPFVIPYILIILIAIFLKNDVTTHDFLAGASILLMMCSNFVSSAFSTIINNDLITNKG